DRREQGLRWVRPVKILDRVAHGFRRTAQAARDAPADLGKRAAAHARQAFRPSQNVLFLVLGELREASAALDPILIGIYKTIHDRLQVTDLPSPIAQDAPAHQ